jgi:hypothetical protein
MSSTRMVAVCKSNFSYMTLRRLSTGQKQPFAFAFCLLSIFLIFIVELIAFRWGTSKLAKLGVLYGQCRIDYPDLPF